MRKAALCVGLDPAAQDMLPRVFRDGRHGLQSCAERTAAFCRRVLELVAPYAGVVKPQAAFFELLGPHGLFALADLIRDAGTRLRRRARRQARRHRQHRDRLRRRRVRGMHTRRRNLPDLERRRPHRQPVPGTRRGQGRSSPQPLRLAAASSYLSARAIRKLEGSFRTSSATVNRSTGMWGRQWPIGTLPRSAHADSATSGPSWGATHPRELAELREAMPKVWFLVPGYGLPPGGTAADVKAAYRSDADRR